ncbi:MAG TPA: response regulator [Burkholderiaceae bacterium]|nr:response regulator [Burkholderiaceae bacterium]
MKIHLVDDNPDMLASLKLILQRRGFQVEVFLHAAACMQAQTRQPADVLITDLFMPDIDGLQVIQEFRARWPQTRIIAISGGGATIGGDYLSVAADIGADLTLRKPFDPEALLGALATLAPQSPPASG